MEPTLNPESGFLRLRIDFSYDGTGFSGWAKQVDRRTIQGELEAALEGMTRNPVALVVAGRTDAGVHATHAVAHVDIPERDHDAKEWDLANFTYRLNRILADDVRIHNISLAPAHFHARFSALRRHYVYKIADNQQLVPPLKRIDVATWYRPLSVERMNEASARLLGEHDFTTFCKPNGSGSSSAIRRLEVFSWRRDADGYLYADVIADAFCYSMVRNIVGAVVCVGEGRFEPEWISTLLEQRKRVSESLVFPARGLTLVDVEYPADSELLERSKTTIGFRTEFAE